jgi:hypothetical protein
MVGELFDAAPTHNVMIWIPDAEERSAALVDEHVDGNYKHNSGLLIAADAGMSLRHEIVHVFHHAHMDRLGQQHPMWIMEGLACLFEEFAPGESDDGVIEFQPNERRNIAKGMLREGALVPWDRFFALSDAEFNAEPAWHYAQARSVFEFLADESRLATWYRTYVEHFDADQTGARAFELAFDQPMPDTELRWRAWLERKPTIVTAEHVSQRSPAQNAEPAATETKADG